MTDADALARKPGRDHAVSSDRAFVMTLAAGLERLSAVLDGSGFDYAGARNTDRGPGRPPSTSVISPYLRRRLLTEAEVLSAAVKRVGDEGVAKFVSEVFWL